ncbi:hypothetical protein AB0I60_03150 [Actinosynnema sp. NPDC050436]|uniref:hypothetical protein n=1 Tax=Actinosynnema sp. NPDC050436 TaxID=3155659 RepID=UPI00341134C9
MSVDLNKGKFRREILRIVEGDHLFAQMKAVIDARRAEGVSDETLIAVLTELMMDMREQEREEDEEFVANGLDEIADW